MLQLLPVVDWLPAACRREVLDFLSALELVEILKARKEWKEAVMEVAQARVVGLAYDEGQLSSEDRGWLRTLRAYEKLASLVGAFPKERSWRDEWTLLECRREFAPSAAESRPERSLRYVRPSADWKVKGGWPEDLAIGHTLLMTKFKSILGESLRRKSPEFAASCHLVSAALGWRASFEPVAPRAYNDLNGPYGLRRADSVWGAIASADVGYVFETTTPLEASASPSCLTASGFRAPVIDVKGDSTDIQYQPQDSDVVCFESRPPSGRGFHSLVRTAHTAFELQYDLPPLATICLTSIQHPGTWTAFDNVRPMRKLYTVTVTFL